MGSLQVLAEEVENHNSERGSVIAALAAGIKSLSVLAKGQYGGDDEDEGDGKPGDAEDDGDGEEDEEGAESGGVGAQDMGKADDEAVDVTAFMVGMEGNLRDVQALVKSSASSADVAELRDDIDERLGRMEKALEGLITVLVPMGKGVSSLLKGAEGAEGATLTGGAGDSALPAPVRPPVHHSKFGLGPGSSTSDLRKASPAEMRGALVSMTKGTIGEDVFRRFKLTGQFSEDAETHTEIAALVAADQ